MSDEINPDLKCLTLDEMAVALQVSTRTVRRLIDKKAIPAFKALGQWRIREVEFKKWLEGRERPA